MVRWQILHCLCAFCCGAHVDHASKRLVPSVPVRAELKEGDSSVYELLDMLPGVYYEVRVSCVGVADCAAHDYFPDCE